MITKLCLRCKRDLPTNQFQSDRCQKDGFYSLCKECKKKYRQANKDKLLIAQYARRVGNTELSPMRKAWNVLYYALKTGEIKKPETCSVGGEPVGKDKIQGHHRDYNKPLDVIWCCQDCHVGLDRERREVSYYAKLCSNT
jgi:hypothetical protein